MRKTKILDIKNIIQDGVMLTWAQLCHRQDRSARGKVPQWFKEVETKLIENIEISRKVKKEVIDNTEEIIEYTVNEENWSEFERIFEDERDKEKMKLINNRIFEIEKGIKNNNQVVDRIVQLMIDNVIEDRKELTFYTDASLNRLNNHSGIGIVQIENETEIGNLNIKIDSKKEINHLETVAIMIVLLMTPRDSIVSIYTNSKNAQTLVNDCLKEDNNNLRKLLNKTDFIIRKWINDFIKDNRININIVKVKAHSNNKFNEKADKLAKVTGEDEITINWAEFNKLKFNIWWKDTNLTDELRRWTKELNLLRWKAEVILSSKFEYRWIKHNLVDWEWSSKLLKNDMRETDEVDSQVRSFIIKNYLEKLPTLERLNERYGKLYTSDKCMRCDRMIENWQHIWICEKNDTTLRELVDEAAIKIWKKERKEVTTSEKIELEKALKRRIAK